MLHIMQTLNTYMSGWNMLDQILPQWHSFCHDHYVTMAHALWAASEVNNWHAGVSWWKEGFLNSWSMLHTDRQNPQQAPSGEDLYTPTLAASLQSVADSSLWMGMEISRNQVEL